MAAVFPPTSPCGLLEFGAVRRPGVRWERIDCGIAHPVRLLYASDLHLGHWWTRRVPQHLLDLAKTLAPDVILLGGDLVDRVRALPSFRTLVQALAMVAPVSAIAGNHDHRTGLAAVRAAVREAGAHWLPERPVKHPLRIEAELSPACTSEPRVLCAHAPAVFPAAAQAGYRLVLAGHLHGGQCVLATRRGRQYPAAWFHRWHGLRFRQGHSEMLVSRGLADTFPFRFNCPREVLVCEIG